jgi:hypothetical protein
MPRFTLGKRWDGSSGIRVIYEDAEARQNPIAAVKYWYTLDPVNIEASNVLRATVYTRAAVYKFARFAQERQARWFDIAGEKTEDGYWPIKDPGDASWPLAWMDTAGKSLGIAVVPFLSPRGSLLSDIIGLNNALNKTNLDMLATADQQGFGLIAVQYETLPSVPSSDDPSGDGLGLRPGSALETTGKVTKLAADDMKGLLDYARHLTISISSNSDIPFHDFVPLAGEVPSGAALQELGRGLAEHAEECTVWFGGSWQRAMQLAQRLEALYGSALRGEPVRLTPVWKPVEYQDPAAELEAEKGRVEIAILKQQVSSRQQLRELGYSDKEIGTMLSERQADDAAMAQRLMTDFDRGGRVGE